MPSYLRIFRHHRLYTFAFAGTLALAVATAIVSLAVVRRAFLDPLPYPESDRLVALLTASASTGLSPVSPHVLRDLEASDPPLVDLLPIRPVSATWTGDDRTEMLLGNMVTPAYFRALGVTPLHGRVLEDDDGDGVMVSAAFWQSGLGGAPTAVGSSITLDGVPRTIVGIVPADFLPPYFTGGQFWSLLDVNALLAARPRSVRSLTLLARRAPGASPAAVDAFLATFSQRLVRDHPQIHHQQTWVARPLRAEFLGATGPALWGVGAAAALLVLIVTANIAGLAAARGLRLQHQLAVRAALGASRRRLLGEQLGENLLVALVGCGAGLWLGAVLIRFATAMQGDFLGRMAPFAMDPLTALTGIAIGIGAGCIAGFIASAGVVPAGSAGLLSSSRGGGTRAQQALRSGLVVGQVALALVLVAGAGLLIRSVVNLSNTSLGFSAERVTTFHVNLPGARYDGPERHNQLEQELVAALTRVPGVVSATASVGFPVVGGMYASLRIQSQPAETGVEEVAYMSIAPNFLASMGIAVLAGRGLEETDVDGSEPVVVINETMARRYWPAGDALGARIRVGPGADEPWITVVGIVSDVRQHGPTSPVRPTSFGSTRQYSWPRRMFAIRTAGPIPAADLLRTVHAIDPGLAVTDVRTVDDMVSRQTARHRLIMVSLAFFGAVATVLSGLGLYGVVALTSMLRRREYALRIALGAPLGNVRWLVVRQALLLAGTGTVVGLAAAAAGTRVLTALLHGVSPMDGVALAAAVTVVVGLAAGAAWLPARAAGRVSPVDVLKAD